ncbi:histidine kinase [Pseudoduganella sp. LjRoot289]|uniref:sensor histidine kinase n=1 Tax=Pseudoduganella sp. LjRoot289 TaxID=3342314 RepID=UPI003ECF3DBE
MNKEPDSKPFHNVALPTLRQLTVVLLLTLQLSWLLHTMSATPYATVAGHIVSIGMAMLLAFTAAARLRLRWLPQPLIRLAAVALTAPAATFAALVAMQRGNTAAFLHTREVSGYAMLAIVMLLFGTVTAAIALRMERRARERADRLQAERERNTLERELLDARLRLLQAQIEPHFLFNTLANIQALVESGSEQAAPVLRHLIAYLRAAMPRLNDADATLGTELQLVRAYLELMHLRMPDRLQFQVDATPGLNGMAFPAMALLTLVENAVRHGIDPSTTGGSIAVGGEADPASGAVTLWVEDSGIGMSESAQPGTGLGNVRTRLLAFYGPGARLDLHEAQPHGLRVELIFQPRSPA